MHDENLLEPAKYYASELKANYKEKLENFFDKLVLRSQINIEENDKTNRRLDKENDTLENYRSSKRIWITLLVISIIVICVTGFFIYNHAENWQSASQDIKRILIESFSMLGFGYLTIQSILKIRKFAGLIKNQEDVVKKIEKEAWEQVSPLLGIINTEDYCKIIHQCVPSIQIASFIPDKLVERLKERSEHENELLNHIRFLEDKDNTAISTLSGCVDGKIFIVVSYVRFVMGTKTYTGSISLPYTDYVTDSNGDTKSVTRYEVLTASVTKPFPFYYTYHRGIYFNEACPNLTFFRNPININAKSEREFRRIVKKSEKKFIKIEKNSMKSGGKSFTPLSDTEFEALFNTVDRDNDVEFRMMYTPYAIKQFTDFVKSQEGFGDNFYLEKDGCCTSCILEDGQIGLSGGIRPQLKHMLSYSYRTIRSKYMSCGQNFFKNIYFVLAPLFMVPIYAEGRDENFDELFKNSHKYSFNKFDAESLANANCELFRPNGTSTDIIIKSIGDIVYATGTLFTLQSFSFAGVNRVELVYTVGFHTSGNVPVHWIEYISKSKTSRLYVMYLGLSQGQAEYVLRESGVNFKTIYNDGFVGILLNSEKDVNQDFIILTQKILDIAQNVEVENV